MRRLILVVLLVLVPALLSAQTPRRLSLATQAPRNSVWERELRTLATAWQQAANVRIQIHPNGSLGDEIEIADTIRARRPSPQIAALSAIALSHIDSAFNIFSMPFFFASYPELYAVLDAMTPALSRRLDERGLVLLAWGHVGWAHMFTTKPVTTLGELQQLRIWSSGDVDMIRWFRENGFGNVQTTAVSDLQLALQSGRIEAIPTSPTLASANQWYRQTKYMLDLGIAPIIGAVVMAKPSWEELTEAERTAFRAGAERVEAELEKAVPQQDEETIAALQRRGQLTVTTPTGSDWQTLGESLADFIREGDAQVYEEVRRARDAFRQKNSP